MAVSVFYYFPPCLSVKKTACLGWDALPIQNPSGMEGAVRSRKSDR